MPIQGGMGQVRGDQESINTYVEQLRRRLAEKVDQANQGPAKASTLPNDTFDLQDPMLEAALTDSTMQFFLEHMTAFDNLSGAPEADTNPRHEPVPTDELRATLDHVARFDSLEPPDLHSNLHTERFWIIADLVFTGDTLSRHLATIEIRQIMAAAQRGEIDEATVRIYYKNLQAMTNRPLLFDLLARVLADRLRCPTVGVES